MFQRQLGPAFSLPHKSPSACSSATAPRCTTTTTTSAASGMAKFLVLSLIIIIIIPLGSCLAPDSIHGAPRDRAALLSFANGITDDPQGSLATWRSPEMHVCNWTGVTCHRVKDRVVQLDLSGRDLAGAISPAVANLSFLAVLDLSGNLFSGRIPWAIGGLSRLKQLSLASNLLTGPIPRELELLSRLVYLDLGSNQLVGRIPEALFRNCSSLQYVDLSNNSLAGEIPLRGECRLQNLRFILLWSNNLIGPIPPSLSNSSEMEWVDLESNYLTGELPSEVFDKMPYLQFLYLSYNNLSSHGSNTDLKPFFDSLGNCSRLQELELAGNSLGGVVPPSIGMLSHLVQLHIEENLLYGSIPPNISNLVNLTYLNLSNNFLNGSIPPEISQLGKLERLFLSNNLLSGEIPVALGGIPHLGLLDISENRLSGPIPDTFSNLTQLRRLMLHSNLLSGMIPRSLGDCVNLETLDLSHNQLTGRIPGDVASLRSLKLYLNFSNNYLEGSLPLELSKMDMLPALDLSHNHLSGAIPPQLGSCIALEYLNLSSNALTGQLPRALGGLPYLQVLDLSSNRLEGALPESLKASSTLTMLNISFNYFSGAVPDRGVFASLPANSFLGNPGLCGSISGMSSCTSGKAHRRNLILPILLTTLTVPCVLLCLFLYPLNKKSRLRATFPFLRTSPTQESEEEGRRDYPRISYRELVEATGGFSGANLIGSGRFGQVYKGILQGEKRIAVKVLNPKCGVDTSKSFKRECEVLRRTRHRNLIRIITACSKPDFKALVLPLMPNGSLADHLYPPPPPPPEAAANLRGLTLVQLVTISSDIAEGLAYLHHYAPVRVVHCDLKPSNVLLDDDMTALVSDFGIARLMKDVDEESSDVADSASCISTTGLLCGSVGYIAPEYGMGGQPSTQGDVYSFGVLLLEMVTGKQPTDIIFCESLTLQEWVKKNYPENIDTVTEKAPLRDSVLLSSSLYYKKLRRDVLMELIELGLVCTQSSPSVRPAMNDVAHELALMKQELSQHAGTNTESSSISDFSV